VTTVIVIRHAERDEPAPGENDPRLNEAGRARATTLIHVLGQAGIRGIYTSEFARARETARPLSLHLHVPITELGEPGDIDGDIRAAHAGQTTLVVGHSNTVPELIRLLGARTVPSIGPEEFDDLLVVAVGGSGEANVTRLKYGSQS
jgi:broad specificity phosphatase PhoE